MPVGEIIFWSTGLCQLCDDLQTSAFCSGTQYIQVMMVNNVNVHPLEGDQGPYRYCSRCVCCIRAGLGVTVYFQILGSRPVKSTSAVKMLLEYVVFYC